MGCCESRIDERSSTIRANSKKFQFELYAAIKRNDLEAVTDLIPGKFNVNYHMPSFMGRTALHIAAEYGGKQVILYLLERDANVNALDNSGCPPIFLALSKGNLDAVEIIADLGTGVDLNITTSHNMNFHDFICSSKQKESISLLKRLKYSKIKL
jgi:ankyrin repeat protein